MSFEQSVEYLSNIIVPKQCHGGFLRITNFDESQPTLVDASTRTWLGDVVISPDGELIPDKLYGPSGFDIYYSWYTTDKKLQFRDPCLNIDLANEDAYSNNYRDLVEWEVPDGCEFVCIRNPDGSRPALYYETIEAHKTAYNPMPVGDFFRTRIPHGDLRIQYLAADYSVISETRTLEYRGLATTSDTAKLQDEIDVLGVDLAELTTTVSGLKVEVENLARDLTDVKRDFAELTTTVSGIRTDLNELTEDIEDSPLTITTDLNTTTYTANQGTSAAVDARSLTYVPDNKNIIQLFDWAAITDDHDPNGVYCSVSGTYNVTYYYSDLVEKYTDFEHCHGIIIWHSGVNLDADLIGQWQWTASITILDGQHRWDSADFAHSWQTKVTQRLRFGVLNWATQWMGYRLIFDYNTGTLVDWIDSDDDIVTLTFSHNMRRISSFHPPHLICQPVQLYSADYINITQRDPCGVPVYLEGTSSDNVVYTYSNLEQFWGPAKTYNNIFLFDCGDESTTEKVGITIQFSPNERMPWHSGFFYKKGLDLSQVDFYLTFRYFNVNFTNKIAYSDGRCFFWMLSEHGVSLTPLVDTYHSPFPFYELPTDIVDEPVQPEVPVLPDPEVEEPDSSGSSNQHPTNPVPGGGGRPPYMGN